MYQNFWKRFSHYPSQAFWDEEQLIKYLENDKLQS